VRLWSTLQPYYQSQAAASRATEAVLNALILSSYDAPQGRLSRETLAAFDHMWALQEGSGPSSGAWPWLQFNNEPWEARDSPYYGAVLAALAVGTAPEGYRSRPEIEGAVERLRQYLEREYPAQSLINRIALLEASTHLPGLLDSKRQRSLIDEIWGHQERDGGWSSATLLGAWTRRDGTPLVSQSDGYATGLTTWALQQAGTSANDPRLGRGLSWLVSHQSAWDGRWVGYSLNKERNHLLDPAAKFMDDAATAYTVLALCQAGHCGRMAGARARDQEEPGSGDTRAHRAQSQRGRP
jgi:squalene-hopene/tetraprenyl-beta-curcumene cyclase